MIIQFSPFAYNVIQHYKNCLMLSKYHCTEERANGKAQEMVDYIIGKVSDATIELQECPYVKLGKKNGAKGNAFNKMLKWFQYKVSANNAWGVSVLYDENGNALVYRIVHCSYLKEPSPGWKQQTNASQQDKQEANESAKWIPLQDFNKQIQEENTMKKLNITRKQYNESKYFQKKYGTLEYVSESGNVYKTSKGETIRLMGEGRYKQINFTKDELLDRIQEYIIKFEEIRNQLDELSEFFYKNVKQSGRDFLRSAEYNSLSMHEQHQVYDTIMNAINTQGTLTLTATAHRSA